MSKLQEIIGTVRRLSAAARTVAATPYRQTSKEARLAPFDELDRALEELDRYQRDAHHCYFTEAHPPKHVEHACPVEWAAREALQEAIERKPKVLAAQKRAASWQTRKDTVAAELASATHARKVKQLKGRLATAKRRLATASRDLSKALKAVSVFVDLNIAAQSLEQAAHPVDDACRREISDSSASASASDCSCSPSGARCDRCILQGNSTYIERSMCD